MTFSFLKMIELKIKAAFYFLPALTQKHVHIQNCNNKSSSWRLRSYEVSTTWSFMPLQPPRFTYPSHTPTHTHAHTLSLPSLDVVVTLWMSAIRTCFQLLFFWTHTLVPDLKSFSSHLRSWIFRPYLKDLIVPYHPNRAFHFQTAG